MDRGNVRTLAGVALVVLLVVLAGLWATGALSGKRRLVLATTTSPRDSGLLDYLIPLYEEGRGVSVKAVAVGTGQALEIARRGDADVVLVHAPAKELEFLRAGHAAYRLPVMYNYFALVGPPDDPAGIRGKNVVAALQALAAGEFRFVSRGDHSGTHLKEMDLWADAGVAPVGAWYKDVGNGMGAALFIADEMRAYTLADEGTFAVLRPRLDLAVLVNRDPPLKNPYSVMPVDPGNHTGVAFDLADDFARWLASDATKSLIENYTVNGDPVFFRED